MLRLKPQKQHIKLKKKNPQSPNTQLTQQIPKQHKIYPKKKNYNNPALDSILSPKILNPAHNISKKPQTPENDPKEHNLRSQNINKALKNPTSLQLCNA